MLEVLAMDDTLNNQQHEAAKQESTKTGLFDLSAELRNEIYRHALLNDQEIRFLAWKTDGGGETKILSEGLAEPDLLRTSKQIRAEGLPIFYGGNVFRSLERCAIIRWLELIGPKKVAMLKQVRGCLMYAHSIKCAREVVKEFEERVTRELGLVLTEGVIRSPVVLMDGKISQQYWQTKDSKEYWVARNSDIMIESAGCWSGRSLNDHANGDHTVGRLRIKNDEPLRFEEV